jgi:hypothetical protein
LLELGAAANAERERRHGSRVYFSLAPLPVFAVSCPPADLELSLTQVPSDAKAVQIAIQGPEGATTGEAEIRSIALARLTLAADHIAADWTALTPYVAQVALRFGADTLVGIPPGTPRKEIVRLIEEAGRQPFECDAAFQACEAVWESALPVLHS